MRFRGLAWRYARLLGYFWLPCQVCRREFGGHEWRKVNGHVSTIPDGWDQSVPMSLATGICPECTAAGVGCLAHAAVGNTAHPGCAVVVQVK